MRSAPAKLGLLALVGLGSAVVGLARAIARRPPRVRAHGHAIVPKPPPAPERPRRRRAALVALAGLVLLAALGGGVALALRDARARADRATALTGGDPEHGRALIQRNGCAGCHTISGVPGARGRVGPPLDGVAQRVYIGGVLTNTPANLMQWIRDPRAVDSKIAMPSTGVSEAEARDIAAFLYAQRE